MLGSLDASTRVSVGIPTYNRPAGLRRTLEQIGQQTYRNLEILVSDNSSTDPRVREVGEEAASRDGRVRYYRQAHNIGMFANFRFVLQATTGNFFMWAADDDEWDPRFIAVCMDTIGSAGLAMQSHFRFKYRSTGQERRQEVPPLSDRSSPFVNAMRVITGGVPSLFYGLYRRHVLVEVIDSPVRDGLDLLILLRLALTYGINTFEEQLYTTGVEGSRYEHKPAAHESGRGYAHTPLFLAGLDAIAHATRVSRPNRLRLAQHFVARRLWAFAEYERPARPFQAGAALIAARVLDWQLAQSSRKAEE